MAILIIADHDNAVIRPATLNAVTAAAALGGEIHLLVAGADAAQAAGSAASVNGVAKALLAEAPHYAHGPPAVVIAMSSPRRPPPARTSRRGWRRFWMRSKFPT